MVFFIAYSLVILCRFFGYSLPFLWLFVAVSLVICCCFFGYLLLFLG